MNLNPRRIWSLESKLETSLLAVLLLVSPARAAGNGTYIYTGIGDGSTWTSAANWSTTGTLTPAYPNQSNDIATFNSATGATLSIGSTNIEVGQFQFNGSSGNIGSFTFNNGASSSSTGSTFTTVGVGGTAVDENSIYITSAVTQTAAATETFNAPIITTRSQGFDNDAASANVTITVNGNITTSNAAADNLYLNGTNQGANTINGVISNGTTAALTVVVGASSGGTTTGGTANWVLTNVNNSFSGGVEFLGGSGSTGGTLKFNNSAELGSSSTINWGPSAGSTAGAGTLEYTGSGETTTKALAFNLTSNATVGLNASGTGLWTLSGNITALGSANRSIVLGLTGTGLGAITSNIAPPTAGATAKLGLTKTGTGTWTLSGTNTYNGLTSIQAGTLDFATASALYNSTGGSVGSATIGNLSVFNGATAAFGVSSGTGTTYFNGTDITNILTHSPTVFSAGASIGFDTTNASGGSFTFSSAIADTSNGALGVAKLGTGALHLTAPSTYSGGTTVSGGTLYVENNTGSGTGTGAVTVQSGGTLAGYGTIATTGGAAVTVQAGGTLASGGLQTSDTTHSIITPNPTTSAHGLTLTSNLNVNGGATLTFALGSGASTGILNYTSPNLNSTYITEGGTVNFGTTGGAVKIDLVDLTAFTTTATLQLRNQNPYLLISAGGLDSNFDLVTTGGYDENGLVLGIGSAATGNSILNTFSFSATDINGAPLTQPYNNLQLYLFNGQLEVIPEPNTWAMMLSGLCLLAICIRRRNRC